MSMILSPFWVEYDSWANSPTISGNA